MYCSDTKSGGENFGTDINGPGGKPYSIDLVDSSTQVERRTLDKKLPRRINELVDTNHPLNYLHYMCQAKYLTSKKRKREVRYTNASDKFSLSK